MINLSENSALNYISKISFMQTACLKTAFDGSALAPDVWVQRVNGRLCAVASRLGGRLNITAENADIPELKEFISVIGFNEIFCEKDTALSLGFKEFDAFTVLKKRVKKQNDFCGVPSLKNLYASLLMGADGDILLPEFEFFAADISHRLRHGGAVAILEDFGAAVAIKSDFGGIINGISVNKGTRGQGFGSKLLKNICGYLDGDVFVCARTDTAEFYIKNGFVPCDEAVLIRG